MHNIAQLILGQEQRRCAAMCSADVTTLDAMLDANLWFSHATGAVDDKVAYLGKLKQGRIVYRSIDWSEQAVAVMDGDCVAILTGRMNSAVAVNGVEKRLDNRVLAVWIEVGGHWRLRAFQSTPLPAG